jgi:WhiB family redox-sensing transcriptional regulator
MLNEARLTWQEEGSCRGVDPEVFFPISDDDAWRAKEICGVCHVRSDCLAFSLQNRERYGVWGGVTERERSEMLRRGVAQRVLADALRRAG